MSHRSSLREQLEQLVAAPEGDRLSSASQDELTRFLLRADKIVQPVEVAKTLSSLGLPLRKAHNALNRLAQNEAVVVSLPDGRNAEIVELLNKVGVVASPISIPSPNIKEIRERYALSQSDFAAQFGLELRTLQNWEQGRPPSDTPTRVFFKIVETDPEIVLNVMSGLSGRRHYFFDYWHDESPSPLRPFTQMWAGFWSFTSQKFENAAVHLTGTWETAVKSILSRARD